MERVDSLGKFSLLFSFGLVAGLFSLEESPWLHTPYEFYLHTEASYSRYSSVNNGNSTLPYPYNNYENALNLAFAITPTFETEIEVEFARTPSQLYGFRSGALSGRYAFLDDIAGDPVSLVLGGSIRGVASRSVKDISSPYSSYMNYELFISLGKEISEKGDWIFRGYVTGVCGLANHGSFWDRFTGVIERKFASSQVISLFALGYFGYGKEKTVNINSFSGWGYIDHSSVDLGAGYRYCFFSWGELGASFSYRVLAKSYPERAKTFTLFYTLPFSLF